MILRGKREFVSDTAIFDERCIPGNSAEPIPDFSGPFPPEEGVADGTTFGPPVIEELDDRVGVDAVNDDAQAPLPLPPLPAAQAPPKHPDDDVPRQDTPPASPPLCPAAPPIPDPPSPRSGPSKPHRRTPITQLVPPHPYANAQPLRHSARHRAPGHPPPVAPVHQIVPPIPQRPKRLIRDTWKKREGATDEEIERAIASQPSSPSASIEEVADEEELDDGHEDTREDALCAALADGVDYMRSEWVTLDVHEVLELVFADSALKADTSSSAPKTFGEAVSRPDGQHFLQAAVDEVKALVDNGTFIVRERRPTDRPIGSDGFSSSSGKQMGLLTTIRVVLLPRFLSTPWI